MPNSICWPTRPPPWRRHLMAPYDASVAATRVPYFFARPAADPPWPGLVVCLEGYGMDQWLLRVCERLAREGCAAIAPDMYHRFGGSDRDAGPDHIMKLKDPDALSDISECIDELKRA